MKSKEKKKHAPVKRIVEIICFASMIISIGYAIIQIFIAPGTLGMAQPNQRLKSDYILILLQGVAGLVVMFLPSLLQKKFHIEIPNHMVILYLIFLYCGIYLGEFRNFYHIIPHWDTMLHTFSGGMLGALGFSLVYILNTAENVRVSLSPAFVALFAFCFALAVGAVWEIYEYTIDSLFGTNMQKMLLEDGTPLIGQAALRDTMKDIIVDALGALVVTVIGLFSLKARIRHAQKKQNKAQVA